MQAVFRFNGSEEIVVSNQVNGVLVEIIEGSEPGWCGGSEIASHRHDTCGVGKCPCNHEGMPEQRRTLKSFSKSEARALASAIMGAAAQL